MNIPNIWFIAMFVRNENKYGVSFVYFYIFHRQIMDNLPANTALNISALCVDIKLGYQISNTAWDFID